MNRWQYASGLLAGAGAALFALRVALEAGRPGWGILVALLCLPGGWIAWQRGLELLPLSLTWLYVCWPVASPTLAWAVGGVAIVALFIVQARRCSTFEMIPPLFLDTAVFVCFLLLYIATLAPDLLPADSGEFQIVGPLLGVAHPPGYAIFTLLTKLFSLLPIGQIPWRVNLMGAVSGALTVTLVGQAARRLSGTGWAGLAAAAALGVSTTFWAQSTTLNIRALTVLCAALCCNFLIALLQSPPASAAERRYLLRLGLVFGIGAAHHASLLFWAPVFFLVVLWRDPSLIKRWRVWLSGLAAFATPFLFNLYIIVRAITGAPFGTDNLVDAQRVLDHLLMRGFGGDMFAYHQLNRFLWERFRMVGNTLLFQFDGLLLGMAAIGLIGLLTRQRKAAWWLNGLIGVMAVVVVTYRAPQSVEYLMPAYVPLALCIGEAAGLLARRLRTAGRTETATLSGLLALIFLAVLVLGQANLPGYAQLHQDRSTRQYAESVLQAAPPNAHILACWHWATPLWYLQLVEGRRPDVTIEYIPPQGSTAMPDAWPQIIAERLKNQESPLIVTNYYLTYNNLPFRFEPLGEAFLVRDTPNLSVPTDLTPLNATLSLSGRLSPVRILGYRLIQGEAQPGGRIVIDLIWQPTAPLERDFAFFVHLVGDDAVPLGQADRTERVGDLAAGEVRVDRYEFPVMLHAAPGYYRLIAGAYLSFEDGSWQRLIADDGQDTVMLSDVTIRPGRWPAVTLHSVRQTWVGGPTLIGVDYDDTLPGQRRVYLHWQTGDAPARVELYDGAQRLAATNVAATNVAATNAAATNAAATNAAATNAAATNAAATNAAGTPGYVSTALDIPPDAADLRIGLSAATDGAALFRRGAWGLAQTRTWRLRRAHRPGHYVPFGGQMALVGVNTAPTWSASEQGRVALEFVGLRALVGDAVISVHVAGPDAQTAPSDGVPALGAIPTFKWLPGSRIRDVHLIDLPAGATGEAEIALAVYDAFVNNRALPPLDERIARLGRSHIPLTTISVENRP